MPVLSLGPLWTLLDEMRIEEPGAARTFEQSLAAENGWSDDYASAVSREYRRFPYLAATAGMPVTPSRAVDKAWHHHLTYSRHYWSVLCNEILGQPLHHEPSAGGEAEEARHATQYAATLGRYASVFGEPAPRNIWPRPDDRQRGERDPYKPLYRVLTVAVAGTIGASAAFGAGGFSVAAICSLVILAFAVPWFANARRRGNCGAACGVVAGGDTCNAGCGSGCGGGCGS